MCIVFVPLPVEGGPGRKQVGFSLIELMVTVAVMAVILTIAVPGMTGLIRDAQLASQSDLLVSTLNQARTEAIRQRTTIQVCPSATPNSDSATDCLAGASAWSSGWMTLNGSTIASRSVASAGLVVSTTATKVEFNGTIGSATASASFVLCTKGRAQHVVDVSSSGHISKSIGTTICT